MGLPPIELFYPSFRLLNAKYYSMLFIEKQWYVTNYDADFYYDRDNIKPMIEIGFLLPVEITSTFEVLCSNPEFERFSLNTSEIKKFKKINYRFLI